MDYAVSAKQFNGINYPLLLKRRGVTRLLECLASDNTNRFSFFKPSPTPQWSAIWNWITAVLQKFFLPMRGESYDEGEFYGYEILTLTPDLGREGNSSKTVKEEILVPY